METIKSISFYLVISFIICVVSDYIKSSFLTKFLVENIITLQVTLLAINTATLGLIVSKIQDILEKYPANFSEPISEMKKSLKEQIILIIISLIFLILFNDNKENIIKFEYKKIILDIVLLTSLIYYVDILRDTGKSVFIIIDSFNKKNN